MSEEKKIGISNSDRAHVLVQAMPYIKRWAGETIVVKYGGNAMINPELKEAVMNDIVLMQLVGVNVVLVHGGGPEITDVLGKMGKKSTFVDGVRVTSMTELTTQLDKYNDGDTVTVRVSDTNSYHAEILSIEKQADDGSAPLRSF